MGLLKTWPRFPQGNVYSFAVTIPLAMKLDEKTIFNVLLALMAFEVLNRLFLADFIDGIVPAKKTGGFERTV